MIHYPPQFTPQQRRVASLFESILLTLDVVDTTLQKMKSENIHRDIIAREIFIMREFSEDLRQMLMQAYAENRMN